MNAKDNAEPVRVEKAFPAIVSKAQFGRVNKLMRSRAPKTSHPRRVGSTYLLSGLVKCKACNRALSGQDAKSGQFAYYVCQSIMKRGKNACVTPRLNARRFEQMIVDKIRSNILTEGSITELVRAVDEEMDGIASEQRKRLKTTDDELEDVKRRLGRIWNAIETSDIDIADASDRIKEHRERKERLEDAAADARAILSERRAYLDDVSTIAAYAKDMKDFLQESELTERRGFIESFVKEIIVIPGDALIRYTVPMPDDSFLAGRAAENVPLDASVLSTVHVGPPNWTRTDCFGRGGALTPSPLEELGLKSWEGGFLILCTRCGAARPSIALRQSYRVTMPVRLFAWAEALREDDCGIWNLAQIYVSNTGRVGQRHASPHYNPCRPLEVLGRSICRLTAGRLYSRHGW